ncbi:FecR family protein [Chitinophagaceae bacterium 26-R-25]|nr:FecR family protein [Chitinophagaceae bacterium 26-R-25]
MSHERFWELIAKKLSREATQDELHELELLMRNNPEWQYAMQNMQDIWNLQPKEAYNSDFAFEHHLQKMNAAGIEMDNFTEGLPEEFESPRRISTRKFWLPIGVASAIVIAAVLIFKPLKHNSDKNIASIAASNLSEVSTKIGSKSKLVLPDGTTVWLNAGSKLTYNKDYDVELREVNLSGEAFFDVVKSADKPFIIHTERIDIRVLGTSFNVKSYPGEQSTETSLIKGKVEISIRNRPSEKIILQPNEKLIVNNQDTLHKHSNSGKTTPLVAVENVTRLEGDSTIVETSWVENKLVFSNTDFEEIVRQMQRWYGISIELKNEPLKKMRFSGTFTHETITQALDAMKITTVFHYTMIDNNSIVITP